jgi:NET1-associated nuclear protein 1 (U3 small nucleolar RNA-associated protein 17)
MASNCIQIVHHGQLSKMITSLTKSITGYYGAGVTYDGVSNCVVTNGRPGSIQFYNLATDHCVAAVDVTKQNVIIATGSMSNAANVTKVEIKGNRMVTVDRMDDGVTRPRDIVRVWSRDTKSGSNVEWIEDVYIERAHISAVTDIKIIDESTFVTSGADSKLKRWIIENGELRNSHVGNYRDDPILSFDISEDGTTVTTCDESKCSIFSAYDMSYQDITLPTLEEGQKIEKVFHGRGNSSHLLVVKHSTGFFIWDLCTCACVKAVKVDCSKSSFEMFRSDSDDFFGLVEEKNLKSKISIFSLAEVLPMVIVDSDHLVKSICFSKRTEERTTGVKVLNSNKICVLNNHGSLLEIVSDSDMAASRESSKPAIKLSRKNMKTPVGGLLSALITPNDTDSKEQMKEKIKINNQKLSDLLYLPAYMMPNSNEYCSQIISTLMSRPDLTKEGSSSSSGSKLSQQDESADVESMEMETDDGSVIQKSTKVEEDLVLDKTSYESLKNTFDSVCLS